MFFLVLFLSCYCVDGPPVFVEARFLCVCFCWYCFLLLHMYKIVWLLQQCSMKYDYIAVSVCRIHFEFYFLFFRSVLLLWFVWLLFFAASKAWLPSMPIVNVLICIVCNTDNMAWSGLNGYMVTLSSIILFTYIVIWMCVCDWVRWLLQTTTIPDTE